MTIQWTAGIPVNQDPDAKLDYRLIIADWLDGDEIFDVSIIVDAGATTEVITQGLTDVHFWVSTVTARNIVTLRITTTLGRIQDFSFTFVPTRN